MSNDLQVIRQYFFRMNRILTWSLVILVALVSATLWVLDFASTDVHSTKIGIVLMGLAVVFYKLPHISFIYTKRRFKAHPEAEEIFTGNWRTFRKWAYQT